MDILSNRDYIGIMKAEDIKKIRQQLGDSQTELAKRLGVTLKTVYRWETGEHPIPKMVELALKEIKRNAA